LIHSFLHNYFDSGTVAHNEETEHTTT